MDDYIKIINQEIENLPFDKFPNSLYEPIRYIFSVGGKRLRPTLVLLAYGLFKPDIKEALEGALAVESFHNFTLMHDDIMDEAPTRRGKATVNKRWDNTTGILSGDAMLIATYEQLRNCRPLDDILKAFNESALEVCEGQRIDMDFEKHSIVSESQYIDMIRQKTAVLLGFSLKLGGMMAGVSKKIDHQLYQIGVMAGIGFQLMDDYLDVYGKVDFGKQRGGDIIANKKTFLLIKALEKSSPSQEQFLKKWLCQTTFDVTEKVETITALYNELAIDVLTKEKIQEYYDQSFALLEALPIDDQTKRPLVNYFSQLMHREV